MYESNGSHAPWVDLPQLIGESPEHLQQVMRMRRLAGSDAPVLISGESGTGKEVFARAIHQLSGRREGSFQAVNCGALPEHLFESELFGHKKGAFTGAIVDQPGIVHLSDGGTLFLDEIDSLPLSSQVKLLRFLQEGEYRAVGSQQTLKAKVRIIAAANAHFDEILRNGKFRPDLFYRLNVLRLALPPLRDRLEDIPLLVRHFLAKQAAQCGTDVKAVAPEALERLLRHRWPGNVRELENIITRALVLAESTTIEACDLELGEDKAPHDGSFNAVKSGVVRQFEREYLRHILAKHEGNISSAAREAKKNRRAFWELLRKYDLHSTPRNH